MDILKLHTVIELASGNNKIEEVSISIAKALTPTAVSLIEATGLNVGNLHITCNWAIEMWKQSKDAVGLITGNTNYSLAKHYASLNKALCVDIRTSSIPPKGILKFNDFIDDVYGYMFLDLRAIAKKQPHLTPQIDDMYLRMSRFYEDKRRLAYCDLSYVGVGYNGMTIHLVP